MEREIRNALGVRLDYAFHGGGDRSRPVVVVGHGVTGNKDRPWAEALCEGLAAAGASALRFSFAGNGNSEGEFRECTVSKEVPDLGEVLDAVEEEGFKSVVYAGHSMGGAVGVLRAAEDARIGRLISLAGMVHTAKFAAVEFGDQTPDAGCMWEDENCPLSSAFVDDMNAIGDMLHCAEKITVPWLLVHGTEDDVVPIGESREIAARAGANATLVEIPGANHVFSGEGLAPMIKAVTNWLGEGGVEFRDEQVSKGVPRSSGGGGSGCGCLGRRREARGFLVSLAETPSAGDGVPGFVEPRAIVFSFCGGR